MLKIFCIVLIGLTTKVCIAEAQKPAINTELEYFSNAKSFITEVYGLNLEVRKFILMSEPEFGCKLEYSDLSFFSVDEISRIKKEINQPKIKSWQHFVNFKGNCLTRDSLNRILKNNYLRLYNGWNYLQQYLGNRIASISSPIFFQDYKYCLFYSEYSCDFKCAQGEAVLYKKDNGKWTKLKTICSWIA